MGQISKIMLRFLIINQIINIIVMKKLLFSKSDSFEKLN